jgi:hypothetical protein
MISHCWHWSFCPVAPLDHSLLATRLTVHQLSQLFRAVEQKIKPYEFADGAHAGCLDVRGFRFHKVKGLSLLAGMLGWLDRPVGQVPGGTGR